MTICRITDGATVCDLIWNNVSNRRYMLARDNWAPQIPLARASDDSALGPYTDVVEEIGVNVFGESASDALSNLATLHMLLDQAHRWDWERENVSAITFQYTPTGGANLLQTLILGRELGDETANMDLPVTFNHDLQMYQIADVKLRFRHRAPHIGPTDTATSSSAANPSVLTATFATSHLIYSPTKIAITGQTIANAPVMRARYLLLAASASKFDISEGEGWAWNSSQSSGGSITNTADAANLARGGAVGRVAVINAGQVVITSPVLASNVGSLIDVFVTLKNNSGASGLTITAQFDQNAGFDSALRGPERSISTDNQPQIMYLGRIALAYPYNQLHLIFKNSGAGTTNVDVDYVVLFGADDPASQIIVLDEKTINSVLPAGAYSIVVDPGPLARHEPFIGVTSGATEFPLSHRGDTYPVQRLTTLSAVVLGTMVNYWRIADAVPSAISHALSLTRYKSYLVPQ
jgi:hypothetical protein